MHVHAYVMVFAVTRVSPCFAADYLLLAMSIRVHMHTLTAWLSMWAKRRSMLPMMSKGHASCRTQAHYVCK